MQNKRFFLLSVLFLVTTFWLGFGITRTDFGQLLVGWLGFFAMLFFILKVEITTLEARFWIFFGIFLRFLLLFSTPNLSDDVWRFVWDGRCWLAGVHPFEHLPAFYFEKNALPSGISVDLYEKLNSKNYFTVYPPVCQLVFAAAAFLGQIGDGMTIQRQPAADFLTIFALKTTLFFAEIGILWLLFKKRKDNRAAVFYALCPLAIFEVIGNVHFESLMLFWLLLSLNYLEKQEKLPVSAFFFALSVSTKLLPLMFLPLILAFLGWQKMVKFGGWLLFFSLILWIPMLNWQILKNMGQSLDLYFRAFEFNASLYYLIRPFARNPEGFGRIDLVGPMMAMVAIGSILWISGLLWMKKLSFSVAILWISCIQLWCSTTVHPWYALVPMVLSFGSFWRFPQVWAATIVFSYSHYIHGFKEHFGWIIFEYSLVVGFLFWEIYDRKIKNINHLLIKNR